MSKAALRAAAPGGVRVREDAALGQVLEATRGFQAGEVVLCEKPLLIANSLLPPLAALKPLCPPETATLLVSHEEGHDAATVIGGSSDAAWPATSTFDNSHMSLVLEFLDAATDTQTYILKAMQYEMGIDSELSLPSGVAASECIAKAVAKLVDRGAPWTPDGWDLHPDVESLCPGSNLLSRLFHIFTINAHAFGSGAALFDLATKLTHTCGPADVQYTSDDTTGFGIFTAVRDIVPGKMLTMCYLRPSTRLAPVPQRRRMLYCQKGFVCQCPSCVRAESATADPFRRKQGVEVALSLEEEERLSGEASRASHNREGQLLVQPTPAEMVQLQRFLGEAEASLGGSHYATQVFRRIYYSICAMRSEDAEIPPLPPGWVAQCESYLLNTEVEAFHGAPW